jgi:hypothetical protein
MDPNIATDGMGLRKEGVDWHLGKHDRKGEFLEVWLAFTEMDKATEQVQGRGREKMQEDPGLTATGASDAAAISSGS